MRLFSSFLTKEVLKGTSSIKDYVKFKRTNFTVGKYHLTSRGRHGFPLSAFRLAKPQHSQDQRDPNPEGFSEDYSQFGMNERLD